MKDLTKTIIVLLLTVVLMACGSTGIVPKAPTAMLVPTQTSAAAPTFTPLPTATPEPSFTPTLAPTVTQIPATDTLPAPTLPLTSITPQTEWNGIPIMPGASAGQEDVIGFHFSVAAPASNVEKYYEKEMAKLGWNLMNPSNGSRGGDPVDFPKRPDNFNGHHTA